MADKLKVLQLGAVNWTQEMTVPDNLDWYYLAPSSALALKKVMKMERMSRFAAVLIDDLAYLPDLYALADAGQLTPYTLFYDRRQRGEDETARFFLRRHCAQAADFSDRAELVRQLSKGLFRGQYGDKMTPLDLVVSPHFHGQVCFNGYENLELLGGYGEDFRPILSWKYNVVASRFNPVELWLEYEKDMTCEIRLRVHNIQEGSTENIIKEAVFSEEAMSEPLVLDNDFTSYLGVTLEARGYGRMKIGALHQRLTRYQFGKYVLGGQILKDRSRQEINYFFSPGDFKPPLAVYFSGYRRAEGFEGYGMMNGLGLPFLLFSDPRVDGGVFYLGSEELEEGIRQIIQEHLDLLGFSDRELILSGMSMGTYGAMYYGADFRPQALILSKPLTNLGTIAQRGRLLLPKVFPTALDVLHRHTGGKELGDIEALNQRFWDKFRRADFSQTTFGIAYMKEEDYDPTAYQDLLLTLSDMGAKVISKGISGRHNDAANVPVSWFMNYYKIILEEGFGRKK